MVDENKMLKKHKRALRVFYTVILPDEKNFSTGKEEQRTALEKLNPSEYTINEGWIER